MRVVVFFDLPVTTVKNRQDYRKFRKYLIKSGFVMMQESVYVKLVPNNISGEAVLENIRKNKPDEGLIQVLRITEKQFSKMEFVAGERKSEVLDSSERLVIL